MRHLLLFLVFAAAGLVGAEVDPLGIPLPPADVRGIRELQSRNLGAPTLDSAAPRQEALMAVAELGGAARSGNWSADDQAALFALLQNYRDELLGLGMDAAELEAQLAQLRSRAEEVERRLAKLKPKDGLKVHGRYVAALDDLHVFGNGALISIPAVGANPSKGTKPAKSAYKGSRTPLGMVHGVFDFQGTRGPASVAAKLGVLAPWGTGTAFVGFRRIYLELRLPVAIQFGDVDASLSPLTLWRNDTVDPYVPEPFASREQRLRDDLLLVQDRWRVRGARASTELRLMDAFSLDLENTLSAVVYNSNNNGAASANTFYQIPRTTNLGYIARYNIYMDAWQVRARFGEKGEKGDLAYRGILFWDDTNTLSTVPAPAWSFRAMNSMVNSVGGSWALGPVRLEAEGAMSAYVAPSFTYTAQADPLTGTAYTAALTWKAEAGKLKLFGRGASIGFHAAGAQGRTVDREWQFLGPFLSENSQLDADGRVGIGPSMTYGGTSISIPESNASRLNDVLIPPGMVKAVNTASLSALGGAFDHLLPYFAHEEIDPYGAATPNRAGFGGETDWKLFSKAFTVSGGYEMSAMPEKAADSLGNTFAPFNLSRMRAGADIDLAPLVGWPLSFGGGYTMTQSANGQQNAAGKAYSLNTSLMDANLMLGRGKALGLAAGYRMLSYEGLHPLLFASPSDKQTWDMLGIGGWWRPQEGTSVDLVYSNGHMDVPDFTLLGWQAEQVVLRLTTEF